jgi:2'-5' RNA ligase
MIKSVTGSSPAAARRLFVAVDPPPEAVSHLGDVVDTLAVSRANAPGRSTRLAARDRWHVTLVFLGDVREERVEKASGAMSRAAAAVSGPIRLCFAGGGKFGRGRFTILWAGVGGDIGALHALIAAMRRELRRSHLPLDDKPSRPHLTIARPGARVEPDLIAADVATLASYAGPEWTADTVHLVASELGPQPRHTRVASSRLGSSLRRP